jgi:hypothetical protein
VKRNRVACTTLRDESGNSMLYSSNILWVVCVCVYVCVCMCVCVCVCVCERERERSEIEIAEREQDKTIKILQEPHKS